MTLETELEKEREKAETSLEKQEREAREEVRRETESTYRQLQRRRGTLLEQTQRAKSQVRQAERLEQRKADLPLTQPRDIGASEALEDIKSQAQSIEKDIKTLEDKVKIAEASALADIERQVKEKRAELDTLYQQGLGEIREWKSRHIKVKDDWITKDDWDRLDSKSQSKLKELGIEGYQVWVKSESERYRKEYEQAIEKAERKQKEWEASHIKLAYKDKTTGEHEWVSKADWEKLSTQDKTALMGLGTKAFNFWKKSLGMMEFALESYRQAVFEGKYIEVKDGEWMLKTDFDNLSPKQQVIIKEVGIDLYNSWNTADYKYKQYGEAFIQDAEAFRRALGQAINAGDIKDPSIEIGRGTSKQIEADYAKFRTAGQIKAYWEGLNNQERGILWNRFKPTATVGESWVQAAEMFIPGVAVARHWDEMSNEERGLHIALDLLIVGVLVAKPIAGATRSFLTNRIGNARFVSINRSLGGLKKAIDAGNAPAIKISCNELRIYGKQLKAEGKVGGQELINKANWFERNAELLAKERVYPDPRVLKPLRTAERTLKNFIERERILDSEGKPIGWRGSFQLQRKAGQQPIKVKEHPLTRQEFEQQTRNLTTEQRRRIANTSAETREQVLKEIRQFAGDNAKKDRMWKDIERQLEQARKEGKPAPVKLKREIPQKGKPSLPQTAKQAEESRNLMARQWIEQNRTWGAKRIAEKIAEMTTERQIRMRRFLEQVLGKTKGREVSKIIEEIEKAKLSKLKKAVGESAQEKLAALTKEFTTTGQGASQTLGKVMTAGMLNLLLATNTKLGLGLIAKADTKTRAEAMGQLQPAVAQAVATQTGVKVAATTALKEQVIVKAEELLKTEPLVKTVVKTEIKVSELPKITKPIRPEEPKPRKPTRVKKRYIPSRDIRTADGRKLTKEELEASVAWKQGFIYKLLYPPYGEKNIINTKEPIPGVKYHAGPHSAARSLVKLYEGELPPRILRDMGIMDVEITRGYTTLGGTRVKPKIKFRQDKKQITDTTPRVGGVR